MSEATIRILTNLNSINMSNNIMLIISLHEKLRHWKLRVQVLGPRQFTWYSQTGIFLYREILFDVCLHYVFTFV